MVTVSAPIKPPRFAHLHVHTEYSDLDGMTKIKDAVAAAATDGQPGLAVTDHGSTAGTWELAAAAKAAGIKPVLGIEAYLAIGSRFAPGTLDKRDGDTTKTADYQHLTVLARTRAGWRNLLLMHEASQHSRKGKHPLIDYDLLTEHGDGLIVLTGCLGGPVAGPLARGDEAGARAGLDALIAAVGKDNVYIEVMEHDVPDEDGVAQRLADLGAEYGIDLVATNDSHYTKAGHAHAHEAWLAIQTQSNLKAPRSERFCFKGEGYWLRTAAEMYALREEDWWAQACANTVAVVDRIEDDLLGFDGRLRLPKFAVPPDCEGCARRRLRHPDDDIELLHFDHLVLDGAKERYGSPLPAEVKDRLRAERSVIVSMGMHGYFLIVAEMIGWARSQGIATGPGRGSAAGAATSYALRIVNVDPIRGGLLFERFLDPTRVGMPDIDSDFEQARRPEVLRHLTALYGQEFVAQIGTLQVAASRGAIKRAQQALGHPAWMGDKLTKAVPMDGAKPYPFARIKETRDQEGAAFYKVLDDLGAPGREIANLATRFESVAMGKSIHACGVVIGDEPLTDLVPLRREASFTEDTPSVTEWEAAGIEGAGLLKLDVLGLRNLDIVTAAVRNIAALTGETVDLDHLPDPDHLDDSRVAAAYDLYARGNTSGLFQMDGEGLTTLATKVRPTSLEDLSALLALYRPGPMAVGAHDAFARRKAGTEQVDYDYLTTDPAEVEVIDSVLGNTLAVITYQEQIMQLAERIAGFDAGQKSTLRKAFSKKDMAKMLSLRDLFFDGGTSGRGAKGVRFARKTLDALWVAFEGSASYLFNKSHSYAYGYLSFVTAYLKANWPAPYGAAMLSVTKASERRAAMLASLKTDGIAVQPPSVNTGDVKTTATSDDAITLGLGEIRDVGAMAEAIVAERTARGPFTSLADLAARVRHDGQRLNSKVLTALVTSGACDEFGPRKAQARIVRVVADAPTVTPGTEEWGVVEKAVRAHKYIGVFVGDHPMKALQAQVKGFQMADYAEDPYTGERTRLSTQDVMPIRKVHASTRKVVRTLGMVTGAAQKLLKSGMLVSGTLEGQSGAIEFASFRTEPGMAAMLTNGSVVAIKARRDQREIVSTDEEGAETVTTVARLVVNDVEPVPYTDSGQAAETRTLGLDLTLFGTLHPAPDPTETTPAPRAPSRRRAAPAPVRALPAPAETARRPQPVNVAPAPAASHMEFSMWCFGSAAA